MYYLFLKIFAWLLETLEMVDILRCVVPHIKKPYQCNHSTNQNAAMIWKLDYS